MFRFILITLIALNASGCSSFGYYMDLMAGHSELLEQREAVSEILLKKETTVKLRNLLEKSQEIREFSVKELKLPDNDSYRMYADLKRRYAVWNVVAAEEFSIDPKKWCFLFVGCLSYRGYFSKEDAQAYADELKKEGYDVFLAGANAYSTLGWFDDPLLNTMMYKSEARRAGIIFHELAHQVVYIDDDSAFNEAFATTVEEEGIRRWFIKNNQISQYQEYLVNKKRDEELNALLQKTRVQLGALYKKPMRSKEKKDAKANIFTAMKLEYQKLKSSWNGYDAYDEWMSQDLNNAHLLLIATYNELLPSFKAMLKNEQNNLQQFYIAAERLGQMNKKDRKVYLQQWAER